MKGSFQWGNSSKEGTTEVNPYTTQDFAFCGYSHPASSRVGTVPFSDVGLGKGCTGAPALCPAYFSARVHGGGHTGLPISPWRMTPNSRDWSHQHFRIYTSVEPTADGDFLSARNFTVQANEELRSSGEEDEDATIRWSRLGCFWYPP